jgi:hypothetical protein
MVVLLNYNLILLHCYRLAVSFFFFFDDDAGIAVNADYVFAIFFIRFA